MSINPLATNLNRLISPIESLSIDSDRLPGATQSGSALGFGDILSDSLAAAGQADAIDKASSLELLMGQSDDLSALMLDIQKAELSLNLALQVRNKVIDAYNEVMRMQV